MCRRREVSWLLPRPSQPPPTNVLTQEHCSRAVRWAEHAHRAAQVSSITTAMPLSHRAWLADIHDMAPYERLSYKLNDQLQKLEKDCGSFLRG
ncbi:hypothetical protein NDU88_004843 [Pleurodeles waltl]|uniref:Uncharacterized protein n=1 Tax=Pleurodeles waltl TaxID=8319 RepID=A0AAV7MUN3_PLEWA|nr:hypothetical protein NDU88_004843 [Pleurodeles waltl]